MDTNITDKEAVFLDSIDEELAKEGKTDKKCPRCGNDIILERLGSSYSIRCKNEDCIGLVYRGI